MKTNQLKNAFAAILMAVVCNTAAMAQDNQQSNAQQHPGREQQGKMPRMTPEQMADAKAKHIARELALDDVTTEKFVATYKDYVKDLQAAAPRMKPDTKKDLTEAEAEKANKQRFDNEQKVLDVRQKYYKSFSKFLTQKQILRVQEMERKHRPQHPGGKGGHMNQKGKKPGKKFYHPAGQEPKE